MPDARPEILALRELRSSLADAFPEPEHATLIALYLEELSHWMAPPTDSPRPGNSADDADRIGSGERSTPDDARHQATARATEEDAVTLLCKLEDYLESILVGRSARRSEV